MELLEHALEYVEKLNWHIFPVWWVNDDGSCGCGDPECRNQGKHPIPRLAPHGACSASNDPKFIRRWWNSEPRANIALHCGPSGVLALDLDSYKDTYFSGDVEKLLTKDDEQTATSITGCGGNHLLFANTTGAKYGNHNKMLPPGIDVRCWNAYIVLPPSGHKSGNAYQWEDGYSPFDIEPKPIPMAIKALLDDCMERRQRATEKAKERALSVAPDLELVANALAHVPNWSAKEKDGGLSYTEWVSVLMSVHSAYPGEDGIAVCEAWSAGFDGEIEAKFNGFNGHGVTLGTLAAIARQHGWQGSFDEYDGFAPEAPEMPLRSAPIASRPRATQKATRAQPEAVEAPMKEDGLINAATWPYAVKDGRIIQYEKTKHGVNERPLCNFNAWITADIEVNDGEDITRKVVIAGKLYDGQPLADIELNAKEFESMDWCVTNWGARVSIEPGRGTKDTLRHAIQTLSAHNMEQKSSRSHTGWAMVDGKRVFLHGGGAVGQDNVDVSLPAQLRNYTLPNDKDIDATTAMIESLALLEVAPMRISAPLWATMYLGPLSELITPAFVVSVEGGSGSLKSSYSAVMLNHFGKKFHEYAMPADWLATANSLEKLAFHAKDIPLIIDDFRPTTSATEGKTLMDSVSRIVRATGNRQGRMRLDGESDFKRTYAPRGVVVMTAERKAMGKSVNSRIITIDVEPNDVNKLRLANAQKQRHIYGYAMAGYIEWVAANWEDLAQELPRLVADTRAANGGNGHHLRLPNATAVLYAAFHTAMRYAVHSGAIEQDDADLLKSNCYDALQELAELQNQATDAEDPATKFLTIIATLTAQNKVYLPSKQGDLDLGSAAGDRLGWHDKHELFLLPAAYNTVYQYARNEGWTFPSDENTLRKELKRGGYLARTDGDRFTIKRRDPGSQKPSNVLAIKFDKFAEILSTMSDDEVSRRLDAVAVVAAVVDGL